MLLFLSTLSVVAKIITGHNVYLILFLLFTCLGIYKDELEEKIIYLLFFSAWIYVLKFNVGSSSLYHLLQVFYLVSFLFVALVSKTKLKVHVILGYLLFVFYVLMNSLIFTAGHISFVAGFLLNFTSIAFALSLPLKKDSFQRYIRYYAVGLFVSGIVSLIGKWLPETEERIHNLGESYTVFRGNQLFTRFSGMDIDPNYFAFQVLFAVSLLVVITKPKKENILDNLLILVLVLMGINTLSKMFLILLLLLILYTFFSYLGKDLISACKYLFTLVVVAALLLPLGLLNFINTILYRFVGQGNSAASLTTGRFDLWVTYMNEILSNPSVFFIGNGLGTDFFEGFAAHNMYLSFWYFTGLGGVCTLVLFVCASYQKPSLETKYKRKTMPFGLEKLPLMILLVANLALDSILMNFFPLFLFLMIATWKGVKSQKGKVVMT